MLLQLFKNYLLEIHPEVLRGETTGQQGLLFTAGGAKHSTPGCTRVSVCQGRGSPRVCSSHFSLSCCVCPKISTIKMP